MQESTEEQATVRCGFEVRASFPFDGDFAAKTERLECAAGLPSEFSGAGACQHGGESLDCSPRRELGWHVVTFRQTQALKKNIERRCGIDRLIVTVKEL